MTAFGAQQRGAARAAGVCAVAAATGLIGVPATAHAEVPGAQSHAVLLTSADAASTADAQYWLTSGTGGLLLSDGWPSAQELSSYLGTDASGATQVIDTAPDNNWFATLGNEMNSGFYDFFHEGALTNGDTAIAGTVLPTGPFVLFGSAAHPFVAAPSTSGDDASQLLAAAQAEGALVSSNADVLRSELTSLAAQGQIGYQQPWDGFFGENGPLSDASGEQTQILQALANLQAITPADEHNGFLTSYLSSLLSSEYSMNDTLVDLYRNIDVGNTLAMTADNAALAYNGTDMFDAAQNVVNLFGFEDFLTSIGL